MSDREGKKSDVISKEIEEDEKKYGTMSRFGYFSIPYSAGIGDKQYSQGRKKIYRTEDKKVITEPRGIFTNPPKKGKFVDVYFHNDFKQDLESLKKISEEVKNDREGYIKKIKSKKKGGENPAVYKPSFRPGGPKEYRDFFETNPVDYKIPITKEIDKRTKIDREHKTVFMENRGIYTRPPKRGTSATPGILFHEFREDPKMLSMKAKWSSERRFKPRSKSAKGEFKLPFRPAALAKNDTFQKDWELYGEEEKRIRSALLSAKESRMKGNPKFHKVFPEGSLKQQFAFKPPSMGKSGSQSLFSPVYGVPFTPQDRIIRKKEKQEYKSSFKPNRLVDSSIFSPPATNFFTNMKKDFPTVFRK